MKVYDAVSYHQETEGRDYPNNVPGTTIVYHDDIKELIKETEQSISSMIS